MGASPDDSRAEPLPVGTACPDCGYDLRGSTSARCSECGFTLDGLRSRETQVPWSHRRELGWFKAYWKTVWLVLRQPKRFCIEMVRPVSYADSQSFRWVTTGLAYLPILLGSLAWWAFDRSRGLGGGEAEWWFRGFLLIGSPLLLVLLPGLASCFFHPRTLSIEQQNRAVALSYYAWAPLAFTPLVLPAVLGAMLVWSQWGSTTEDILLIVSRGTHVFAMFAGYGVVADFAKQILRGSLWTRFVRMGALLLVSAGVSILPVLIAAWVFYLLVIYHSLG